jgi:RimJ/RimL family protein N-acetyltransferase
VCCFSFVAQSDDYIVRLYNDPEALKDLPFKAKRNTGGWTPEDATKCRGLMEQISRDGSGLNCMIRMNDGNYAGVAGFRDLHWWNRSAEMGIILHPDYWGQGLATEIHYIFLKWAFEDMKLHRVEFKTSIKNSGMNYMCREVMKANLDGVLRDYFPSVDCTSFRPVEADADGAAAPRADGITLENILYESVNVYSLLEADWPLCKESLLRSMQKRGVDRR